MHFTTQTLVTLGERYLTTRGVTSPRYCSEELLRYVLQEHTRSDLYCDQSPLPAENNRIRRFFALVRKRSAHYPLQYMTQEVGFLDSTLQVREGVFIPRPETELLVLAARERLANKEPKRILDIGTGTGNIAISIAHLFPACAVTSVDISPDALRVATRNASRLGVRERITFLLSDCFAAINKACMFDGIISNPPYIVAHEIDTLEPEVQSEPRPALNGGVDGLYFYRKISAEAGHFLKPNGIIAFEVGLQQARAVKSLLEERHFKNIQIIKDYANIERIIIAER